MSRGWLAFSFNFSTPPFCHHACMGPCITTQHAQIRHSHTTLLAAEYTSDQFALLCNLLACDGEPGTVLHVRAKNRTGKQNFVACMRQAVCARRLRKPKSCACLSVSCMWKRALLQNHRVGPLCEYYAVVWLEAGHLRSEVQGLICIACPRAAEPKVRQRAACGAGRRLRDQVWRSESGVYACMCA